MSEKRKKAKLTPTRSGAQIYMSDSYSKEFLDSIDRGEPTDLRKLMEKKIREKMYAEGATPQEVGRKLSDVTTDQIDKAVRVSNKAKKPKKRPTSFKDGGVVKGRKKPKMGCVMKGRGGKYKGQS